MFCSRNSFRVRLMFDKAKQRKELHTLIDKRVRFQISVDSNLLSNPQEMPCQTSTWARTFTPASNVSINNKLDAAQKCTKVRFATAVSQKGGKVQKTAFLHRYHYFASL